MRFWRCRFEGLLQAHDAFLDQATVGLDLGFARSADEAETAALPLQMGPGTHKAAFLPLEMRQFDLQRALGSAGSCAENLQDQARTVQNLALQGFFQIALLDRCERVIDHHQLGLLRLHDRPQFLDLAAAEERARTGIGDSDDAGGDNIEIDRGGQPDRFLKPGRGRAAQ